MADGEYRDLRLQGRLGYSDSQLTHVSEAVRLRDYKRVYHHWSRKRIARYISEFAFWFNRGNNRYPVMQRIAAPIQGACGKGITYEDLTRDLS